MVLQISPADAEKHAHARVPSRSAQERSRARGRKALALGIAIALTQTLGCASLRDLFGLSDSNRPALSAEQRPSRIQALEAEIEADHAVLENLVSGQREDSDEPLHSNDALRAIAERLTENEEELAALLRAENLVE
ncbi:MAG: hypothetical protein AB8G23_21305 [Myxococcota bacterium]